MSRYLCDTSCLVAALCPWHEHHERTREELEVRAAKKEKLVLAAHSLVETYSVLTRLPASHRLRGADALALLEVNWASTRAVHLTSAETWRALKEAEKRGITGGQTYDALIAAAAMKAKAGALITWNGKNFVAFRNELEIVTPRP